MKKYVLFSSVAVGVVIIFAIRGSFDINTSQKDNYQGNETKIKLSAPRGDIYNSDGVKSPTLRSDAFKSIIK